MTEDETNGRCGRDDADQWRLGVRNVGGIERASMALDQGVTIVAGENASNKSSLLGSLGGVPVVGLVDRCPSLVESPATPGRL